MAEMGVRVAHKEGEVYVTLIYGVDAEAHARLTPEAARKHAACVLEHADIAEKQLVTARSMTDLLADIDDLEEDEEL
jgi:hypothetical protein